MRFPTHPRSPGRPSPRPHGRSSDLRGHLRPAVFQQAPSPAPRLTNGSTRAQMTPPGTKPIPGQGNIHVQIGNVHVRSVPSARETTCGATQEPACSDAADSRRKRSPVSTTNSSKSRSCPSESTTLRAAASRLCARTPRYAGPYASPGHAALAVAAAAAGWCRPNHREPGPLIAAAGRRANATRRSPTRSFAKL